MGSMVTESVPVHGREITEGDEIAGHTIATVLGLGRLLSSNVKGTEIRVEPDHKYIIRRVVVMDPPEQDGKGHCAFCDRRIGLTIAGTGENERAILLPHGPKDNRCRGSKLTTADAAAEAAELSERATA